MTEQNIKVNSLHAWVLAARPKTLSGAAVPVLLGWAMAFHIGGWDNFQMIPAILCLAFAWIMQIDSNLINDYFDFIHGNDDPGSRLGPARACAEGWITPRAMRVGLAVTTATGCLVGLPLILFGGWTMIIIGILCVAFAFLYTLKFSYLGLGDLLVLVFFGIIPVCLTTYVILPESLQAFSWATFLVSIACGLVIDTLLIVNNYRDRDNDKKDGKMTLVVRLGAKRTEKLYHWLGIVASLIMLFVLLDFYNERSINILLHIVAFIPSVVYLFFFHGPTVRQLVEIHEGKALNSVLGKNARNMFIFGLLNALAIILLSL
ncbi:MAG: 1,4-dihydroxy-2-naphthoate octaprenyltransferase [Prevotella sp.]|nr:1,4-dihydroxy-2-naphthoate octaprenyltransferase [Prevotella sp. AGR2160]MDD5862436.1 1,4-dihydroxy-2-naphthoate octaprenyltransferase [Prevotella sp.]